jgi:hypothetical protein
MVLEYRQISSQNDLRVCPGRYLADAVVWIVIARVLAIFDIGPALDEDGCEIVPEVSWSSGLPRYMSNFIVHRNSGNI